jgi:predicted tellurium resistance membrane protein TerC
LEVVLGIDNIFALALLIKQVRAEDKFKTKFMALSGAFILRLILLYIALVLKKSNIMINAFNFSFSLNNFFFLSGGAFLCYKSIKEFIVLAHPKEKVVQQSTASVIAQVIFIDFVFSFDSVLAAIALTSDPYVIVFSIFLSILFMFYFADFIITNIEKSWRINALGLLIVQFVGLFLITEGLSLHVDKSYLLQVIVITSLYESMMVYLEHLRRRS